MSLQADFGNYYGGTWVRFSSNGKIFPFYVDHVRTGNDFADEDYSEESINNLRFVGNILGEDGRLRQATKTISEGLVLKMEELGYITYQDRKVWLSWRPQRSTKKGLCGRRISGSPERNQLSASIVKEIFDSWEKTTPLQRQFATNEGNLLYKGREVGTVDGDNYELLPEFSYLQESILKSFENAKCGVIGEGEQNA